MNTVNAAAGGEIGGPDGEPGLFARVRKQLNTLGPNGLTGVERGQVRDIARIAEERHDDASSLARALTLLMQQAIDESALTDAHRDAARRHFGIGQGEGGTYERRRRRAAEAAGGALSTYMDRTRPRILSELAATIVGFTKGGSEVAVEESNVPQTTQSDVRISADPLVAEQALADLRAFVDEAARFWTIESLRCADIWDSESTFAATTGVRRFSYTRTQAFGDWCFCGDALAGHSTQPIQRLVEPDTWAALIESYSTFVGLGPFATPRRRRLPIRYFLQRPSQTPGQLRDTGREIQDAWRYHREEDYRNQPLVAVSEMLRLLDVCNRQVLWYLEPLARMDLFTMARALAWAHNARSEVAESEPQLLHEFCRLRDAAGMAFDMFRDLSLHSLTSWVQKPRLPDFDFEWLLFW